MLGSTVFYTPDTVELAVLGAGRQNPIPALVIGHRAGDRLDLQVLVPHPDRPALIRREVPAGTPGQTGRWTRTLAPTFLAANPPAATVHPVQLPVRSQGLPHPDLRPGQRHLARRADPEPHHRGPGWYPYGCGHRDVLHRDHQRHRPRRRRGPADRGGERMTRVPRRYRGAPRPAQVVDDAGQPVTFAMPGAPTRDELRRYAQAVTPAPPAPLTRTQREEVAAAHARRRELFPHLYND